MVAITLADALLEKLGGDSLRELATTWRATGAASASTEGPCATNADAAPQRLMGAGKSTVGRARRRRAPARPSSISTRPCAPQAGMSIPEIFAVGGRGRLPRGARPRRSRGCSPSPGPRVVALGGGALLDPARRRAALARARVVTLIARPETLAARTAGPGRPLLDAAPDRLRRAARAARGPRRRLRRGPRARRDRRAHAGRAVAAAVLAAWARPAVAVALGARSYAVRFAAGEPDVAAAGRRRRSRPRRPSCSPTRTSTRHWGARAGRRAGPPRRRPAGHGGARRRGRSTSGSPSVERALTRDGGGGRRPGRGGASGTAAAS